jgi:PKD repeat protein
LAAKNALAIDGSTGPLNKSFETGVQEWAFTCGVCHVGGGQMEYDRDMKSYDPTSTSSDNQYFSFVQNKIVAGVLSSTNKLEIDCLLCHLNSSPTGANQSGTGRAWYQTYKCSASNPIGPMNDPTCVVQGRDPNFGLPGAGPFTPGTAYDPENRNIALKTLSFQYGPALGIGAIATFGSTPIVPGDPTYTKITGITGVPSQISGAFIQGTPASQNCSACHARDDNTPGYPGMLSQVRLGYGNMISIMPAGTAIDVDQCTPAEVAAGNCPNPSKRNTVQWIEFGCKTGMGKRGQRIGIGPDDTWGFSMFSPMFGLGKKPGDPVLSETIPVTNPNMIGAGITAVTTKERIPDADVHDVAGFQCATCHYAIGGRKVTGVARNEAGFIPNNPDGSVTIPPMQNVHGLNTAGGENSLSFGVSYPAETMFGTDHQFAQGDDLKDTYGKNNLDGSVSCEACHIDRTHPKFFSSPNVARTDIDPTKLPPTPTHSGFPAFHIEKIACTTCHIPELYVTPFRLKSRDWTLGFIKKGNETNGAFKNIYDWNFDLVTGRGMPIRPIHQWATVYEKKKIVPVTPAEMPIWIALDDLGAGLKDSGNKGSLDGVTPDDTSAVKTCTYGSRIFAQCSSDADCPGGYCVAGMTTYASPAKTRDVMTAAETIDGSPTTPGPLRRPYGGNINTGSPVPLFDGWPFPDGQGVDTKARIDAMIAATNGTTPGTVNLGSEKISLLKIFHAPFDITHGVTPAEWALGGSKRGGCVSCHSSAQPRSFDANGSDIGPNPNYSPDSVGFFEGAQHWMPQEMGVGNYDMLKNPLTFFADFDCTAIVNGLCSSNQMCLGMCMGVMHNSLANCQQFCGGVAAMGNCGTGTGPQGSFTDSDLFMQNGDPSNNWVLGQCINFMQPNFDQAMGWPAGTAKVMGLMDGINGLQGFTLRETVDGSTKGCNPFIPSTNVAIMNMGGWTGQPADIARATQTVGMMGSLSNCMPNNSNFDGTCTGAGANGYPATCVGGFRNGKGCIPMDLGFGANADCVGALPAAEAAHNPFGLLLSRGEARERFKLQLQQSSVIVPAGANHLSPDNINRLWWPILTEQNPSNPKHLWAWDAAGSPNVCGAFQNEPCCTNAMGMPASCSDGMNVRTTVHANQLLGYTACYQNQLLSLVLNPSAEQNPTAKIAMQIDPLNPLLVNFNASASTNANSFNWTFGDGSTATGTTASHPYTVCGSYNVTLTVTGACGPENTATSQVTINCLPVARMTYQLNPTKDLTVNFDGTTSLNSNSCAWTFGDGGTASTCNAIHTYAIGGTYTATLTVSDGKGNSNTTSGQVNVDKLKPVARIKMQFDATTPRMVDFDGSASLYAYSYSWNFGGPGTSDLTDPVRPKFTYSAPGTYYVKLTVTGITGLTNTVTAPVTIK